MSITKKGERFLEHQRIAKENGERLYANPEIALDALTLQQSTFTLHNLAKFINRHTVDADQFQRVYAKVQGSPYLISLGKDLLGHERFTQKCCWPLRVK